MDIFFDMRVFNTKNLTGVGKYALNLFNELIKFEDINFYSIGNNLHTLKYTKIQGELPISDIELSNKIISFKGYTNKIDLMYSPYYPIPEKRRSKGVITIHDLIALKHPEWFNNASTYDFYDIYMRKTLKNVDHIMAVSNSTKKDIIECYDINPDKITVVYPGLVSNINQTSSKSDQEILTKYNVKKPYMLTVCTLEPRKNLVRVVEAYNKFRMHNNEEIQLVVVGASGWKYTEIMDSILKSSYRNDIVLTSYVSDDEISALYKNALVFIYASLYEGFGSPVLEAMEFGLPIITSDVSSLPEVGGESVIYCDPFDIDSIEDSMTQLCFSSITREKLKLKTQEQKKKFSYKIAAEQTRDIYIKCLEMN